ncbi:hypothetical protein Cgig2_012537 [Carnegiea gigantea]|uniref:Uncharacterized protein n=1 Tax=Carnegiea gigantea TaxID=171969 RepID=A0A9Q1JFX9_9CARY|nr:hypothetical protein Cgig2_012537 [Carnegiea gigantea]
MKEALSRAKEALRLEKEAHAAMKKKLECMRALLMGRGQEDSVTGGRQNEGLDAEVIETKIATSERDDSDTLYTKLYTADMASDEDGEDHERLGKCDLTVTVGTVNSVSLDDGTLHKGGNDMDDEAYATERNVIPMLECDIQPANDVGDKGETHDAIEGSKPSIAKRIRRSPRRRHPSAN